LRLGTSSIIALCMVHLMKLKSWKHQEQQPSLEV